MQTSKTNALPKNLIRIAVLETDAMRVEGFRGLFDGEEDIDIIQLSLPELIIRKDVDIVLISLRNTKNLFDLMAGIKAERFDLRMIVTGNGADEETILKALAAGAKGYLDEVSKPSDFVMAARMVHQGSIWAPRKVLSLFIERLISAPGRVFSSRNLTFTSREKQVLELLAAGRSNREVGAALGIEERTVKAHVAKLMRKVGVKNRISLSVHAITHHLVAQR